MSIVCEKVGIFAHAPACTSIQAHLCLQLGEGHTAWASMTASFNRCLLSQYRVLLSMVVLCQLLLLSRQLPFIRQPTLNLRCVCVCACVCVCV